MTTGRTPGMGSDRPPAGGAERDNVGGPAPRRPHLSQGDGWGEEEIPRAEGVEPETPELPEGAVMGAGCGYPLGDVEVPEGAAVLDLGCGGGLDCFQGFRRVQDDGLLIGQDTTEALLERQRIARRAGTYLTAKFDAGAQDRLPVADSSVDLVVSNCVLNLVRDKNRAYAEIWRVLRPGGRAAISDVVTRGTLSPETRRDIQSYVGCVTRALDREEYLRVVRAAGFREVRVTRSQEFAVGASEEGAAMSITVVATR